jgi:hypothetical protein
MLESVPSSLMPLHVFAPLFFGPCYTVEESLGSKDTEDEEDDEGEDEEEDEYETDDDEAPADGGNGSTLTSLLVEGPLEDEEENADDYEQVLSR